MLDGFPAPARAAPPLLRPQQFHACRYAAAVIDTITSQNIPVHTFADLVPTPLVAHAVSALGCAAGIMITASHNPAEYNGYKVYYCNGCQIIPPHGVHHASACTLQVTPL